MPEQQDFEARLQGYLSPAAGPRPPAGTEERIIGHAPLRNAWALQLVAAVAVLALAIGLGIVLQRARQSHSPAPIGGPPTATASPSAEPTVIASPSAKPTPYPTPTTRGAPHPLLSPGTMA